MKYAYIARYQGEMPEMPVRLMCQWLGVSASAFYASLKRRPSKRFVSNQRLKVEIRAAHASSHRRYGAPMVHAELRAQGIRCGHNRVARLMRDDGLRSKRPRAFRVTTKSDHNERTAENHLGRRFDLAAQPVLNRAWVADITYLPTREGWLYLSMVMDIASRRIIGWHVSSRLDQDLALSALVMALKQRKPICGEVLHHSDRGVQYAAGAYQSLLDAGGIKCSMSRRGNCWDNAVAESFFATLKSELVADAKWESRSEAHRELMEYIEVWYNRKRRHSTLGYRTPAEYEIEVLRNDTAA